MHQPLYQPFDSHNLIYSLFNSLLSSIVSLVVSLKHGTFKTFQYLLTMAVPNAGRSPQLTRGILKSMLAIFERQSVLYTSI